jgi:hypothetical protein
LPVRSPPMAPPIVSRRISRHIALREARCAAPSCAARWHDTNARLVWPSESRATSPPLFPMTCARPVALYAVATWCSLCSEVNARRQ